MSNHWKTSLSHQTSATYDLASQANPALLQKLKQLYRRQYFTSMITATFYLLLSDRLCRGNKNTQENVAEGATTNSKYVKTVNLPSSQVTSLSSLHVNGEPPLPVLRSVTGKH